MAIPVPRGFRLAGVHCGIKSSAEKLDLSLVESAVPAAAAGVYTKNWFLPPPWPGIAHHAERAHPDDRDQLGQCQRLHRPARRPGRRRMAALAAATCGAAADQALVLSTGIIGVFCRWKRSLPESTRRPANYRQATTSLLAAARGMLTTDTTHKLAGRRRESRPRPCRSPAWPKGPP